MRPTGGGLGSAEEAKQGDLWDWTKRKMERHIRLLQWWVQNGNN